jgi:hypothetical protein
MKSALSEAERYLRVDHADLGNVEIAFSFEERYSPKDGGSAGTAFALLLRSLVEGYEIDPAVAVTGDISVNGKVQPIGGVSAKLRGAMTDGCSIALVPADNTTAVGDLLVRGDQMIEVLRGLQVFSATTVDEASGIVRADRPEKLAKAIKLYGELQQEMTKKGIGAIKTPAAQQKLGSVLDMAPNHVTAKYALDIAMGQGPRTLTRSASVVEIFAAAWPFWEVVTSTKKAIERSDLPAATMRSMKSELAALRRVTHPDVENLRKSMNTWIDTIDTLLSAGDKRITESDVRVVEQRRDALLKELKRLDTDEKLIAKMMREGY